jgi:hypothetical protein
MSAILKLLCLFTMLTGCLADDLGMMSGNLLSPTELAAKVMLAICLVLGIGFLFISFTRYRQHRVTPQQMRWPSIILAFVMGTLFVCIAVFFRHSSAIDL